MTYSKVQGASYELSHWSTHTILFPSLGTSAAANSIKYTHTYTHTHTVLGLIYNNYIFMLWIMYCAMLSFSHTNPCGKCATV